MLVKKEGFPEEGELVMCTVTYLNPNSVFVELNEYRKRAMIHISEIAAGRIRNMRDYVQEGKVVVCKVLNINKEKGYIDLSLRRVPESMRRNKIDDVKKEQKAEKIVEYLAKKLKKKPEELYKKIMSAVGEEFGGLYYAFEAVALGDVSVESFKLDKTLTKELNSIIEERIKPQSVYVEGELSITTYHPDGVNVIHKALKPAEEAENVEILSLGGGCFKIKSTASDYKEATSALEKVVASAIETVQKNEGFATFTKTEK